MPTYPIYQVDAFTDHVFRGNPAAVMPLKEWLPEETMQALAAENNLSETAFFVPEGDGYAIRWFTPVTEVPLCGHATLASSFVLFNQLGHKGNEIRFYSRERGTLVVRRGEDGMIVLDFPGSPIKPVVIPELMHRAIGMRPLETARVKGDEDFLVVVESAQAVRTMELSYPALYNMKAKGIVVTAEAGPGDECDFVCRYFAPGWGLPEDPVTGSIHTFLVPFWSKRLGRSDLVSHQVSERGGVLRCRHLGDRVEMAGRGVLYMTGEVTL